MDTDGHFTNLPQEVIVSTMKVSQNSARFVLQNHSLKEQVIFTL